MSSGWDPESNDEQVQHDYTIRYTDNSYAQGPFWIGPGNVFIDDPGTTITGNVVASGVGISSSVGAAWGNRMGTTTPSNELHITENHIGTTIDYSRANWKGVLKGLLFWLSIPFGIIASRIAKDKIEI